MSDQRKDTFFSRAQSGASSTAIRMMDDRIDRAERAVALMKAGMMEKK